MQFVLGAPSPSVKGQGRKGNLSTPSSTEPRTLGLYAHSPTRIYLVKQRDRLYFIYVNGPPL
jgi:hypothetical protein